MARAAATSSRPAHKEAEEVARRVCVRAGTVARAAHRRARATSRAGGIRRLMLVGLMCLNAR